MNKKNKKYWEQSNELRQSMPDIRNKEFMKEFKDEEEGESYIDKINKKLLEYQEIKYVCQKTKIKPFYYSLLLIVALVFILIGYFDKQLTLIIATIYPLFMTFKTLQNYNEEDEQNKIELIHWLQYWILYTIFLNFECIFGYLFRKLYFICKIIFLINCFPINSKVTIFIYGACLAFVRKNEKNIVDFSKNVYDHLMETKNEIEKKNALKKMKKNDDNNNEENLGNIIKDNIVKNIMNY